MNNGFVCIMGIGVVFAGLIFLILITYAMSAVCKIFAKPEKAEQTPKMQSAPNNNGGKIANKEELVAASCAIIAEELGTDVSNIKVTSFKKL